MRDNLSVFDQEYDKNIILIQMDKIKINKTVVSKILGFIVNN